MLIWIIGLIVVGAITYSVLTYNRLVRGRNLVREGWSGVGVQLKLRHDLVPPLVQTVKGYSRHENNLLVQVTEARTLCLQNNSPELQETRENDLARALKSLFAVAEGYPDLKAGENYLRLQDQLVEIEDNLQFARRYYNGAVRDFNTLVQSFPSRFIAAGVGFKAENYFEFEPAGSGYTPSKIQKT